MRRNRQELALVVADLLEHSLRLERALARSIVFAPADVRKEIEDFLERKDADLKGEEVKT